MPTARQTFIPLAYGAVVWIAAAMVIRFWRAALFDRGAIHAVLYFAPLVAGFLFVWLGAKLAGLTAENLVEGTAVAVTIALFLDGAALAWFGSLYGDFMANQPYGAASLLWGVGGFMLAVFVIERRGASGS